MISPKSMQLPPTTLTLYPAAYPSPGKREVNFLPAVALALSLKITSLNRDTVVI